MILSGGIGTRMGANIPKQYLMVNDKPIITYCIETFAKRADIDVFVIIIADQWKEFFQEHLPALKQRVWYAQPGETRQHSIYNGLKVAKANGAKDEDIVVIHDGARPLVTDAIIDSCINGCKDSDGILPVIRMKDTIYLSEDGSEIKSLLKREYLFAGQAPEAFRFGQYIKLHDDATYEEICAINGSTEIAYKAGLHVKLVKGDEMNFKITTPEDLSNFESIINNK